MRAIGWRGAVVAAALSVVVAAIASPTAAAAPTADFYTPPADLTASAPGDLIRTEPSELALRVPGTDGAFPADGRRIMYRSTDANGAANAVTGTYLEPQRPWEGPGPRPLVSLAVGTHGQGDQCAPSKLLNQLLTFQAPIGLMTEYEVLGINALLLQGIAVVVTDYDGLGTPGMHTYVNRAAEAHAVLDAARAARNLPGTSITPAGPVGFWGYSQGGGAAAAAAELAADYAPELQVKGTYAGAPPADLGATLAQIDGSFLTGAIGYAINGLAQAYPSPGRSSRRSSTTRARRCWPRRGTTALSRPVRASPSRRQASTPGAANRSPWCSPGCRWRRNCWSGSGSARGRRPGRS
ncbi:secretory lipase family protein [Rhodococcus sp. MTM3W5.2]|nr:secretory lipase family protein [Rhodococcus sp. MTM3W5.2]